jgi:hypothetical protein
MARTQVELYEALKPHVGEEGARLIAEVVPADEVLTVPVFRRELDAALAEFRAEIRGWTLAFFVPLWIGVYLTLGAIVISIFSGR